MISQSPGTSQKCLALKRKPALRVAKRGRYHLAPRRASGSKNPEVGMPSFKTIYRTVVMIAVAAIGVKAWQLYGPSNEQVKSTVVKAVDMAQAAWNKQRSSSTDSRLIANPPDSSPPVTNTPAPVAAISPASPPALTPAQPAPVGAALNAAPSSSMPSTPQLIAAPATPSVAPAQASAEDRVTALMSKLEKLGASETKLSAWGSSGNLYRFCCRATPADSPALAQHFESVAAEPAVAVEQVLAKVEAWRTARQSDAMLR
jgi:hypothetical protein